MASAFAMPRTAFNLTAGQLLKNLGLKTDYLPVGMNSDLDMYAECGFASMIAETFGVSRQAAEIKINKAGLIRDYNSNRKQPEQVTLF